AAIKKGKIVKFQLFIYSTTIITLIRLKTINSSHVTPPQIKTRFNNSSPPPINLTNNPFTIITPPKVNTITPNQVFSISCCSPQGIEKNQGISGGNLCQLTTNKITATIQQPKPVNIPAIIPFSLSQPPLFINTFYLNHSLPNVATPLPRHLPL